MKQMQIQTQSRRGLKLRLDPTSRQRRRKEARKNKKHLANVSANIRRISNV